MLHPQKYFKIFSLRKNIPMSRNCVSILFSFQFTRPAYSGKSLSLLISVSVSGLKCFSDVRGFQQTHCSAAGGFKTCFTKFDNSKYYGSAQWIKHQARHCTIVSIREESGLIIIIFSVKTFTTFQ